MNETASPPDDSAGTKIIGHIVMEVSDVERGLSEGGTLGLRRLVLWPVLLAAWCLISAVTNSDSRAPTTTIVSVVLGISLWVGLLLYAPSYAMASNVIENAPSELAELRAAGLGRLYISGRSPATT